MGKIQKFEQIAYLYIKDKILIDDWTPGYHIIESTISDELDMSRSPVRSALSVLETENLVEMKPYRGYFVAQKPDHFHMIGHKLRYFKVIGYRLLDRIHKKELACAFNSESLQSLLHQLKSAHEASDDTAFIQLTEDFIGEAFSAAQHPFLTSEIKTALSQVLKNIQENTSSFDFKDIQYSFIIYFDDLIGLLNEHYCAQQHFFIHIITNRLYQYLSSDDQKSYLETDQYE